MGVDLEVKDHPRPGHRDRSEPQLREGDRPWEGSGERIRGPTNRNRIGGAADQGERAMNREALVAKGKRRRSGGRAEKADELTWGDLARG
jgi:hypothetical protein